MDINDFISTFRVLFRSYPGNYTQVYTACLFQLRNSIVSFHINDLNLKCKTCLQTYTSIRLSIQLEQKERPCNKLCGDSELVDG